MGLLLVFDKLNKVSAALPGESPPRQPPSLGARPNCHLCICLPTPSSEWAVFE